MTAIFVFAEGPTVFVASDTKRGTPLHATSATKTHRWSSNVLVAQTGYGEGLQRLFGEMLARQHAKPNRTNTKGVEDTFGEVGAYRLETEVYMLKTAGRSAVNGTLVVAEASKFAGLPATITTINWVTKQIVQQNGPVYADGTAKVAFQQIAGEEYQNFRPGGSGSFQAGAWGMKCIERAIAAEPEAVGWPADIAIIRPDGGALICSTQRVDQGSTPSSHFNI